MYLVVSSSRRWPTVPAMTIERMDVTTMRAINPTAMPTIFLLIDRLNIRYVRLQEMASVQPSVRVNLRPEQRAKRLSPDSSENTGKCSHGRLIAIKAESGGRRI